MLSPQGLRLGQNLGTGGFCSPKSIHTPSTLLLEPLLVSPEDLSKEPMGLPLEKGNSEQTKVQPVYPLSLHLAYGFWFSYDPLRLFMTWSLPPSYRGISENEEGPCPWA